MSRVQTKKKGGVRRVMSHRQGALLRGLMFPGPFQLFHPGTQREKSVLSSTSQTVSHCSATSRQLRPPGATPGCEKKGWSMCNQTIRNEQRKIVTIGTTTESLPCSPVTIGIKCTFVAINTRFMHFIFPTQYTDDIIFTQITCIILVNTTPLKVTHMAL